MIADVLTSRIGLDIKSIGPKKIESDVALRMKECGISDQEEYIKLIWNSEEEFKKLVDIITIPETWFFRAENSFNYLEDYIRIEWLGKTRQKLRVLSIPCSTGEEPYSIAMTLIDCGMKPQDFSVTGIDINRISLEKALQAVYSKNSFRSSDMGFRRRFFREENGLFELDEQVKDSVTFFLRNILDYNLPSGPEYDIIFCRNMLIYFDIPSQNRVVEILSKLLKDDGLLFMGHAETSILQGSVFIPVRVEGAFALRKGNAAVATQYSMTETRNIMMTELKKQLAAGKRKAEYKKQFKIKIKKTTATPAKNSEALKPQIEDELDRARFLADSGMLEEAEEICRQCLDKDKLNTEAYFLLGLIMMSFKRDTDAEDFFNKALYLKPDYYDAMISLAALKEKMGDLNNARKLKERAVRINRLKL
jgi:chemotaxis protein methyltransferase WspC